MDELDEMMGFSSLNLSYEVHMLDIDGECVDYNVYFEDAVNIHDKEDEISDAISAFFEQEYDDEYIGYVDVSSDDDKVNIYLDLGSSDVDGTEIITGVLKAVDGVSGIKEVLINED
ncbi:MAG: hypothetical protein K5656_05835 [Lachnospiraceae bacterium]|nr:hypothetical protein [Lachnospiraceae bacterium]